MTWCRVVSGCGVLAVLLTGCSGATVQKPMPSTSTYDFASEGRFPPVPDVDPQPPTATAPALRESTVARTTRATGRDETAATVDTETVNDPSGWRVQVFAGTSESAAEDVAHELRSAYALPVYIEYIAPYHKVRLGDCASRDVCLALQADLRESGWTSAWVVPSSIQR
jgi:hypothetical protein